MKLDCVCKPLGDAVWPNLLRLNYWEWVITASIVDFTFIWVLCRYRLLVKWNSFVQNNWYGVWSVCEIFKWPCCISFSCKWCIIGGVMTIWTAGFIFGAFEIDWLLHIFVFSLSLFFLFLGGGGWFLCILLSCKTIWYLPRLFHE